MRMKRPSAALAVAAMMTLAACGGGSDDANTGDDTLWVTGDSRGDVARCGAGDDTVYFDSIDTVSANCETQIGPIQLNP